MINNKFWKSKKILITGHSGFIGSWLFTILEKKNVKVFGFSKNNKEKNSFFKVLGINKKKSSCLGDVNNFNKFNAFVEKKKPEIIFHFAAESIFQDGLDSPYKTYKTNIFGTLNLLKIAKKNKFIKCVVFFTTDKVYKNLEKRLKFKEHYCLGGDDPYSGSKSASEILINSFAKSILKKKIFIFRSGNVLGGGDYSKYRLVPDIIKSSLQKKKLIIRNKFSIRPWIYILDTLWMMTKTIEINYKKRSIMNIFNLATTFQGITVFKLIKFFKKEINFEILYSNVKNKEKKFLLLSNSKLKNLYQIKNNLNFKETVNQTAKFYKRFHSSADKLNDIINDEVKSYEKKLKISENKKFKL